MSADSTETAVSAAVGITRAWPPHRDAFARMLAGGKVAYGAVVKWAVLEELFGIKREASGEFSPFITEWLALRQCYEEAGFLVTERGMNGEGFRCLAREEMAEAIKIREMRKADDSLRKSLTLSKVPREGLQDNEAKKLDYWETKAALVGAQAKLILRKRSLPSPESAQQSLAKILKG